MKVIKAAPSYRAESKFSAWILTIARRTCLSEMRRLAKTALLVEEPEHGVEIECDKESVERQLSQSQTIHRIRSEIDKLPGAQRAALTMWMTEDLSYEEIAAELSTSVAAVKSLIFRARQNLEKALREVS